METLTAYRQRARERKSRYNVMLYPSVVRRMDELSRRLGVSRSELLEFAFNFMEATYELSEDYEGEG